MPRPARNPEGVVRERSNGRWQVVISLPVDGDGKYPQLSRTFDTKREAEQWRLDQTDPRRPKTVERGMTVSGLLAKWLAHQDGRIAATTHKAYTGYVTNRIVPTLGDITLDRLTVDDVDDLYNTLTDEGLSPATVRQVHAILRGAVSWGRKRRYVDINVVADADPPTIHRKRLTPPSPVKVLELLKAAIEHDYEFGIAVRLAAATGARRGTIASFRYSDFDFIENTVQIIRSVSVVDGIHIVKGLKHGEGGPIPMDLNTMNIVADYVAYLLDRAEKCGVPLADDFYLFSPDVDCSTTIHPDNLTKRWETIRLRCGVPNARFHDLRHFVPTELMAAGFDAVTVADRLKHASPTMTLDVYSSPKNDRATAAGEHIGRLLG